MQEELLTGSTCMRNFSLNEHARGTSAPGTSHEINMHENFSQDQHARGTSHRINMQEELLTESTCKRTFWSAYGCFSLDVKLYCLLSISPILLLSIFPFCHYCQLFSYYSILFTSVVNCLEPWIYAWLSLFQTMHDLRFKDLGRCLWLKWGDSKQHIHVPRWFWRLSNRQFVLSRDTSDIIISPRENSRQQKRHYTHHPLNMQEEFFTGSKSIKSHPATCKRNFSQDHAPGTSDQHAPGTFTGSLPPSELLIRINIHCQNFSQDQHAEELLTGSTCKRNFSQDQYARGNFSQDQHAWELLTGSTCKRNFSQDQHASGTFHRINMQSGTSHRINMQEELILGSTCMRTSHGINMEEELLTGYTCKRNFSQDQHARGTSHRINIHQELFTVSTCNSNFSQDQKCKRNSF